MRIYSESDMLTVSVPLEKISYLDYPELLINEHERTEMPFRYVKGDDGKPIMPDVSRAETHTSTTG